VVIRQGKTGQTKTIPLTPTALEILKAKAKVRHLHSNLVFPSHKGTTKMTIPIWGGPSGMLYERQELRVSDSTT
jgi:integrase